MIFNNKFLSVAGQKERLTNAVQTVKSAVLGRGVVANTKSQTTNKVLSFAASNPFTTAAIITPVNTISAAKAGYAALPTAAKVAAIPTGIVATGFVVSNPSSLKQVAKAPAELSRFGSDLGSLSANPSLEGVKDVFKNSPVISSAIALGGAAVIGAGATRTIATIANTRAIKENTKNTVTSIIPNQTSSTLPATPIAATSTNAGSVEPITRETQILGKEPRSKRIAKRKSKTIQPIRNSVRVNIINQNINKLRRT